MTPPPTPVPSVSITRSSSPGRRPPATRRSRPRSRRCRARPERRPLVHAVAQRRVLERQVDATDDDTVLLVDRRRRAEARSPPTDSSSSSATAASSSAMTCSCESCGVGPLVTADDVPVAGDDPGEDLRAAEVPLRSYGPPAQAVTITRKPGVGAAPRGTDTARGPLGAGPHDTDRRPSKASGAADGGVPVGKHPPPPLVTCRSASFTNRWARLAQWLRAGDGWSIDVARPQTPLRGRRARPGMGNAAWPRLTVSPPTRLRSAAR